MAEAQFITAEFQPKAETNRKLLIEYGLTQKEVRKIYTEFMRNYLNLKYSNNQNGKRVDFNKAFWEWATKNRAPLNPEPQVINRVDRMAELRHAFKTNNFPNKKDIL